MKPRLHFTDLPQRKPRGVKAMREFLARHRRYWTMNSWNRSSSYAVCVKLSRLKMTREQLDACCDLLSCQDCLDVSGFKEALSEFDLSHDFEWQTGQNGRGGK